MTARGDWAWTAGGLAERRRQGLGGPGVPLVDAPKPPDPSDLVDVAVGPDEVRTMSRRAAAQRLAAAWGWTDPGGQVAERVDMLDAMIGQHVRHMTGQDWLDDSDSLALVAEIRAANTAKAAAARGNSESGGPAELDAARVAAYNRLAAAERRGDAVMRGVG